MAVTFTYGELSSDLGTNTGDGLRNIANTAANFVCNAYRNYADAAVGLPDPTGVGAFNNALYSRLCSPRNLNPPSPPSIPFNGGQCANLPYNVTIFYSFNGGPPTSVFFPSVLGPLNGVGTKGFAGGSAAYGVIAPNAGSTGILAVASASGPNPLNALSAYRVTSVSVVPVGHSDTCGNPSPQYTTPPPPNNTFNNNTTVNVGAGFIINAPITVIPTLIKAGVEINPQIQVNVGPFNVNFDLGGVQVKPNFQIGNDRRTPSSDNSPPTLPPAREPQPIDCDIDIELMQEEFTTVNNNISGLDEKLDEVKDCSCPVKYTTSIVGLGSGNSGVVALPTNAIQIRLSLTQQPQNAKIQDGGTSHPDYYFCGYVDFGDGTGLSERRAVSVADSVFECPVWATSFGWSLYTGYDCAVSARTLVPEKAGAQLAVRQMKLPPS